MAPALIFPRAGWRLTQNVSLLALDEALHEPPLHEEDDGAREKAPQNISRLAEAVALIHLIVEGVELGLPPPGIPPPKVRHAGRDGPGAVEALAGAGADAG